MIKIVNFRFFLTDQKNTFFICVNYVKTVVYFLSDGSTLGC